MAVLQSTWQSSIIQALIDVQEWDQLSVGSSTYRARRLNFRDRSFTVTGSRTWNNLPDAIRDLSL